MKFRIHYEVNGYDDYYIIDGYDVKDIMKQNKVEMQKRNIDYEKNNCWSEKVEE